MIAPEQPALSVRRQCELLRVSRSGLYYEPVPTSAEELVLGASGFSVGLDWQLEGRRIA